MTTNKSHKWHGGKGSNRRPEDTQKFEDSWDRIFGKKATEQASNDKQKK